MKLPFNLPGQQEKSKAPRLGRISPIDVEVSDPIGDWYYFGRVEMWEKEFEFAQKPATEASFVCKKCNAQYTLPPDARRCPKCSNFLTRASETPKDGEKRRLHFYRLMTNFREDEKIIVTDEDYIQNADQVPYTQTRRGRNRMFQVIMVAFGMVYALTLYLMALFIQAGPSIIYYTQQVTGLEWDVGNVAFVFISGAMIWAWSARYHHYVSDWEIQPLRINSVKGNTDFYLLTNSSKLPVFETVLRLGKLEKPAIDDMVAAVRQFEKEEIDRLQSQLEGTRYQLDVTQLQAYVNGEDAQETAMVTRNVRVKERMDMMRYVFLTAAVGVIGLIVGVLVFGVGA